MIRETYTGRNPRAYIRMNRREFLKAATAGILGVGLAPAGVLAEVARAVPAGAGKSGDDDIKDYLHKMHLFSRPHAYDVFLDRNDFRLLKSSVRRFKRLQRTVGHGNFQLLDFDDAIRIARSYSRVGRFTRAELDFLEMIFYEDPAFYGFFGEKPVKDLASRIPKREVIKIRNSGNYLYKGSPLETFKGIKKQLGDKVILTSGVRNVIKQFLLFLNKAYQNKGNLSLASRSLAPPGYSYHGISDFDVGQVGFGAANFTERFITTDVYRELEALGYMKLRYPQDNMLGVRFEPWHIKVKS